MLKRALCICACVAGLAGLVATPAHAVTVVVDAFNNSSSGGAGLATGLSLTFGQTFTITSSTNDLWSAGGLPRYSDGNGLTGDRNASALDDSGRPVGSQIGTNFGLWSQHSISAPYGSLVGEIAGSFFLIGTNFTGQAIASGALSLFYWDSNQGDNFGSITFDVNAAAVPGPIVGAGLPGLVMALGGFVAWLRRRNRAAAA
ncbi:hypothetical protein [Bradyrhizobium sp. McL0615]|uniref:hypothetical protein n=1 Tax=Bradyrhizobium sp. McL0615 TaxID=3415673 RepID=UPI003CEB8B16